MTVKPSESVQFDSWKQLFQWLPTASEGQLMTVFVWTTDQRNAPGGEEQHLSQVRKQAFELVVARTQERLKIYLHRRQNCRDVHLAEDVVQDVLIQVYKRAEQFDPQRSFWGWLYRIARNKYIDALRRLRPGDIGSGWTGKGDEALDEWLDRMAPTASPPDSAALDQERREQLDKAITRLPPLQQTIVRLKRDGVKGTEIAQQIGKSQAYVSQAYHEALEFVRDLLED